MFLKYKCLIILLLFLTGNMMTEAQEYVPRQMRRHKLLVRVDRYRDGRNG